MVYLKQSIFIPYFSAYNNNVPGFTKIQNNVHGSNTHNFSPNELSQIENKNSDDSENGEDVTVVLNSSGKEGYTQTRTVTINSNGIETNIVVLKKEKPEDTPEFSAIEVQIETLYFSSEATGWFKAVDNCDLKSMT